MKITVLVPSKQSRLLKNLLFREDLEVFGHSRGPRECIEEFYTKRLSICGL